MSRRIVPEECYQHTSNEDRWTYFEEKFKKQEEVNSEFEAKRLIQLKKQEEVNSEFEAKRLIQQERQLALEAKMSKIWSKIMGGASPHEYSSVRELLESIPEKNPTMTDVIKTVAKVYSYTGVMTVAICLLLLFSASIPFTDWTRTDLGVPIVDKEVLLNCIIIGLGVISSCCVFWGNSSLWESGMKWKPEFAAFPYSFLGTVGYLVAFYCFSFGSKWIFALAGINLTNYQGLNAVLLLAVPFTFGTFADAWIRSRLFNFLEERKTEKIDSTIAKRKSSIVETLLKIEPKKKKKEKGKNHIVWSLVAVPLAMVTVASIVALITPLVLADSTSDGTRILILNFFLVILNEALQVFIRFFVRFTDRVVIPSQYGSFFIEAFIQLYRRMLLGTMKSDNNIVLALTILSIEEAVMRGTLAERDLFLRKVFGAKPRSAKMQKKVRIGWAVSIVNSMVIEITMIIVSKFVLLAFRSHWFVFNFGYQRSTLPSVELVVGQIMRELTIELAIDLIALRKEMLKSEIPANVFFDLLTPWSAAAQFFLLLASTFMIFLVIN
eukprot:g562.t1